MALEDYLAGRSLLFIVGAIVAIVIFWYLIKNFGGGRLGEDKKEEQETEKLKQDEKTAEKTQKDEKVQCIMLDRLFSDIMIFLRNSGNNILADRLEPARQRISYILKKELSEKMSVQDALRVFTELHALINNFLASLPNDNQKINELAEGIKKHQKKYYEDLIKELEIDEDKKEQLKDLWRQVIDEEQGTGNTA